MKQEHSRFFVKKNFIFFLLLSFSFFLNINRTFAQQCSLPYYYDGNPGRYAIWDTYSSSWINSFPMPSTTGSTGYARHFKIGSSYVWFSGSSGSITSASVFPVMNLISCFTVGSYVATNSMLGYGGGGKSLITYGTNYTTNWATCINYDASSPADAASFDGLATEYTLVGYQTEGVTAINAARLNWIICNYPTYPSTLNYDVQNAVWYLTRGTTKAGTLQGVRNSIVVAAEAAVPCADGTENSIRFYKTSASAQDLLRWTCTTPPSCSISGSSALCVGNTTTLTNTLLGGTWSSSNTAVATVSSTGVVTGIAVGTATITYNWCSGNKTCTKTITVNAVPTVSPLTGNQNVCVGGTTTFSSTTAGGTYSSSNTSIATVSSTGVVTGIATGTATITYSVTSGGCTKSVTRTVNVISCATVGNLVWLDTNGNGIQDAGENGIANVLVTITDGTNTYSATTSSDGTWTITNIIPGTYTVTYSNVATGYVISPTNATGSTISNDSNGPGSSFSVTAGSTNLTIDQGYYLPVGIGDFVWEDKNGNGIQDAGEPGIANVTVTATNTTTGIAYTATTNANGAYSIQVPAGTYNVSFSTPGGYTATSSNVPGDDTKDSDPVNGVVSGLVVTTGTNNTIDAGFYKLASLGNYVWNDTNANGIQDTNENGIANVTVTLTKPDGSTLTAITSLAGAYSFTNLPPGLYSVSFSTPVNFVASPYDVTAGGGNDTNDSDPINGTVSGIQLLSGDNNTTIDAGFTQAILSLGNAIWADANNNGTQDNGELGIAGATVYLYNSAGTQIATTTTDASGYYLFGNLLPGNYSVGVLIPTGFASGTTTSTSTDPNNDNNTDNNGITTANNIISTNQVTLSVNGEPTNDGDASNNTNLSLDIGLKGTGSIGDFVWYDLDADGIQDANETSGVSGVLITLKDTNGNTVATQTTTSTGAYLFSNLPPGTYTLVFSTPNGYTPSPAAEGSDPTKDSNPVNGSTTVILSTSGTMSNATIDAGYTQSILSLGNKVWADYDNDGTQDIIEPGISGVSVKLYNSSGTLVTSTTTDALGDYLFSNLAPGNYSVGIIVPSGYSPSSISSIDPNNDNNTDNNGVSLLGTELKSNNILLTINGEPTNDGDASANSNLSLDFGLKGTGIIGNYVWNDTNSDGIQNETNTGIQGVTVTLKDASGNVVSTTTTATDGSYSFNNVPPGTYTVVFSTPSGYTPTASNVGDDTLDSDPVNGSVTITLTTSAMTNNTVDAGFLLNNQLSLGNMVWYDYNNNGLFDTGEKGISDVTVKLYNGAGTLIATTVTDANGNYLFTSLNNGDYTVGVVIPSGYAPSSVFASNPNDNVNNDNNGATVSGTEVKSNTISLANGTEPTNDGDTNTNTNLTLDFGFKGTGSIGDFVWNDLNGNGQQDSGEPGISGVTVTLTYPNGLTATTTTAANGSYSFANLAPGEYSISFATPFGYTPTVSNAGTDDTKDSDPVNGSVTGINLIAGDSNTTVDAGYYQLASLGNYVWNDENANGIQDATESGISGVNVTISKPNGTTATVTTGSDGSYIFTNLVPGIYSVSFETPTNYLPTTANVTISGATDQNDSDPVNGQVIGIELSSGENDLTIDAGFYQLSAIGNYVWIDANGNGLQDVTETTGISGVAVTATNNLTNTTYSTTTDANGAYNIPVPPGTYTVTFTTPTGYTATTSNIGSDDTKDSDPVNGTVLNVTTIAATTNSTVDAGFYLLAGLGNYVWNDVNANGIQDATEVGIADVVVILTKPDASTTTTTTATDGSYSFNNLLPGTYSISFSTPVGFTATASNVSSANATDANDSDPVNGAVSNIVLIGGQTDNTIDAGFVLTNLTLGNLVWIDANANGVQDGSELGLANANVNLYRDSNMDNIPDDVAIATTTTNASGVYNFNNLIAGNYIVGVVLPTGYVSTVSTISSSNPNNDVLTDNNGISVTGGELRSNYITLQPGTEPTDDGDGNNGNLSLDFGVKQNANVGSVPVTIRGIVFYDYANNNIVDGTQYGPQNTYAVLVDAVTGKVVATQLVVQTYGQSTSGTFSFAGESGKQYYIMLYTPTSPSDLPSAGSTAPSLSTLPPYFHNVSDAIGIGTLQSGTPDGKSTIFTTEAGVDVTNVNFGVLKAINVVIP